MGIVLLYYKYIYIQYPKRVAKWQKQICQDLGLTGRILIAHEGINSTVGGPDETIELYIAIMRKNPLFADVDFKKGPGGAQCFPKLQVKVRDEIVSLGLEGSQADYKNTAEHLTPEQIHTLIAKKPKDLVIFDARNNFESNIGRFKKTIAPNIKHFRDLPTYIDQHLDVFKDKQVLMYCTGGIRCERASAYLKLKNVAKNVYQMDGGIHRYVEKYSDGFFRGKNYVFDGRVAVKINDDILGSCTICNKPCDEYHNCINAECNKHFICCSTCIKTLQGTCNKTCDQLIKNKQVRIRPPFEKATMATTCPLQE